MIGSALKKMAKENGMQIARGVAYGAYKGYALTMCEGSGWKRLDFSTRFYDVAAQNALENKLNQVDLNLEQMIRILNLCLLEMEFLDKL